MSLNLKHIRWLKAIDLVLALFDVKYGRTPLRNLIAATQRLSDVVIQYLLVDVATRVVAGRVNQRGPQCHAVQWAFLPFRSCSS